MSDLIKRQRELAKKTLNAYVHVCSPEVLSQFEQVLWDEYGISNPKGYRNKVTQVRGWFGAGSAQAFASRMEAAADLRAFVLSVADGHADESLLPPPQETVSEQPTASASPTAVQFTQPMPQSHSGTAVASPMAAGGAPQSGLHGSAEESMPDPGASLQSSFHATIPGQSANQAQPHVQPGRPVLEQSAADYSRHDAGPSDGPSPSRHLLSYPERPPEPYMRPAVTPQWDPHNSYHQFVEGGNSAVTSPTAGGGTQQQAHQAAISGRHPSLDNAQPQDRQERVLQDYRYPTGREMGGGVESETELETTTQIMEGVQLGESNLPRPMGDGEHPGTLDTHTLLMGDEQSEPVPPASKEASAVVLGDSSTGASHLREAPLTRRSSPSAAEQSDSYRGRPMGEMFEVPAGLGPPHTLQSMTVDFMHRRRSSSTSAAHMQHNGPRQEQFTGANPHSRKGDATDSTAEDAYNLVARDDGGQIARAISIADSASATARREAAAQADLEATRASMAKYEATVKAVENIVTATTAGKLAWQQRKVQTETLNEALEIIRILLKPHAEELRGISDLIASLVQSFKDREALYKQREEEMFRYIQELESALDVSASEVTALAAETTAIKEALMEFTQFATTIDAPRLPRSPPLDLMEPTSPKGLVSEPAKLTDNSRTGLTHLPPEAPAEGLYFLAPLAGDPSGDTSHRPSYSIPHVALASGPPSPSPDEFAGPESDALIPPPPSAAEPARMNCSHQSLSVPGVNPDSEQQHTRSSRDSVILEDPVPDERRDTSPPMPWGGSQRPSQPKVSSDAQRPSIDGSGLPRSAHENPGPGIADPLAFLTAGGSNEPAESQLPQKDAKHRFSQHAPGFIVNDDSSAYGGSHYGGILPSILAGGRLHGDSTFYDAAQPPGDARFSPRYQEAGYPREVYGTHRYSASYLQRPANPSPAGTGFGYQAPHHPHLYRPGGETTDLISTQEFSGAVSEAGGNSRLPYEHRFHANISAPNQFSPHLPGGAMNYGRGVLDPLHGKDQRPMPPASGGQKRPGHFPQPSSGGGMHAQQMR